MSIRTLILTLTLLLPSMTIAQTRDITDGKFSLSLSDTPAWVTPVVVPPPKPSAEGAVHYLLVDAQARQDTEGEITHFRRMVTQPRSPQGLESESQIEFRFRSAYERLEIHSVFVMRDGKRIDKLSEPDIRFTQAEGEAGNLTYTGAVSATMFLKDIRINDEIHYSFSIVGANPVFNNTFFSSEAAGWRVPLSRLYVSFSVPTHKKLYSHIKNAEFKLKKYKADGYRYYTYSADDIAPILFENDYPNWHYPYPHIFVSEFKNWSEVATWGTQLFDEVAKQIDDDVVTLANTLWENSETPEDYVRSTLEFVQDEIRYLSMSIGVNSHKPNSPANVLANRYGDCKDKTTLFIALLKQAGINAVPALVSYDYRHTVTDYLAAPNTFDHVIAYVQLNGNSYWLDPTRTLQRGQLSNRPVARFGKALLLTPKTKGFSDVDYHPENVNTVVVNEEFDARDWHTDTTLTVTSLYRGTYAEYYRGMAINSSLGEIMVNMQDYYAKYYDTVQMLDFQYQDLPEHNEFKTVEVYKLANFWTIDDSQNTRKADFYHTWVQQQLILPNSLERKTPLATASPIHLKNDVILKISPDSNIELEDGDARLSTSNVNYFSDDSYDSGEYRNMIQLQFQRDHVKPSEIQPFAQAMHDIDNDSRFSFRLTKPNSMQAEEDIDALMQRLKSLGGVK